MVPWPSEGASRARVLLTQGLPTHDVGLAPADGRLCWAAGIAMVAKVVSGGQTGADRAALDAALELGLDTGGWIPRGRRAEDGAVPQRYENLFETTSGAYEHRTELNVRDSDATVVFSFGRPSGGSALTMQIARSLGKPHLLLDLERCSPEEAIQELCRWLTTRRPHVLNVAGPRASEEPRIAAATRSILGAALRSTAA